MSTLTPFQKHLSHFTTTSISSSHTKITLLSSLRGSLKLGLNFPVSLALAIGIRILYGRFPYLQPVSIPDIPSSQFRPHLTDVTLPRSSTITRSNLLYLYDTSPTPMQRGSIRRAIDRGHLWSFWAIAADKSGLIDMEDVRRFQTGQWTEPIMERRRSRLPGKGDVLPFARGGPIGVAAHSWFVGRLFGVDVYLPE